MPEGAEEIEESEKKSKLPMILGFAATLILGVGIGFGGSMFTGGDSPPASAPEDESSSSASSSDDLPEEGEFRDGRGIYPLGLFTVNLRGIGGGKVLRMEIDLELKASKLDTLEDKKAGLRDRVIKLVSDYHYQDVEGLDGKQRLQDDLMATMNKYMGKKARIERVYFSQFVVQ